MTVKGTLAAIKAIPYMTASCIDGEYRVSYRREFEPSGERREATAAYTDDPEDAIGTAKAMSREYEAKLWSGLKAAEIGGQNAG